MSGLLRSAGPALVLAGLALLPFHNKAFTIDDTLFLQQAQHVLVDPWHPTAFDVVWTEHPYPTRMSEIMVSGPVMAYLLVPTVMAGGAEWVAHLTQFLLLVVAICSTAQLGRRLGLDERTACVSALLLVGSPAVLAMAATAMPDIAAMTFAILGLERLAAWRDTRRWPAAVMGAASLALAILARSHALLLLPLFAAFIVKQAHSWSDWRRVPVRVWAPLLAAPVLAVLGALALRDPHVSPVSTAQATFRYSDWSFVGRNLIAFCSHWTLVLPVTIPWLILRWRAILKGPAIYLMTAGVAWMLAQDAPAARVWPVAIAAALGARVLADIIVDGARRRDSIQLALGLTLLAAIPVAFYQHLPSKYLLVSAPAAALLIARALALRAAPIAAPLTAGVVTIGLVLAVLIMRADAAFADLGRRAADEFIKPHTAAGRSVWFAGHWGFQWYAEQAGARCLTIRGPRPQTGDLIVSSQMSLGGIVEAFGPRRYVASFTEDRPGGRIMTRGGGAGFYSNDWGFLPWTYGDDLLDRYTLWQLGSAVPSR